METNNIYERQYQQLKMRITERQRTVERDKPSKHQMGKLLNATLGFMDKYGADWAPGKGKELYVPAGVDESIYRRNFGDFSGLLLLAKGVALDEIDASINQALGVYSYEMAIDRLFRYCSSMAETINIMPKFAVRRFGREFWLVALWKVYPFVLKMTEDSDDIADEKVTEKILYPCFVDYVTMLLAEWETVDFEPQSAEYYKKLLDTMMKVLVNSLPSLRSNL